MNDSCSWLARSNSSSIVVLVVEKGALNCQYSNINKNVSHETIQNVPTQKANSMLYKTYSEKLNLTDQCIIISFSRKLSLHYTPKIHIQI